MRSYHADVGVEGPLARSVTWQVSAYNREDRGYPWLPCANFQAFGLFDSMFPLIPSAGLSLEF